MLSRLLSRRVLIVLSGFFILWLLFSPSTPNIPLRGEVAQSVGERVKHFLPSYTFLDDEEAEEENLDVVDTQSGHDHGDHEVARQSLVDYDWDLKRADGRLMVPADFDGDPMKHPIPILMKQARKKWDGLLARQSKTFAQTVAEYKRRTGRKPPAGFDAWYAFARENNALTIDEFDLIDLSLKPFYAFSAASFRNRVDYVSKWPVTSWAFGIHQKKGKQTYFGDAKEGSRAREFFDLLERFKHALVGSSVSQGMQAIISLSQPDFTSYHTAHDGPHIWISSEERARLLKLVEDEECESVGLRIGFLLTLTTS